MGFLLPVLLKRPFAESPLTRVSSSQAVRLSRIHAKLQSSHIRQTLSLSLSPKTRPAPSALYARRILPSPDITTSPRISARAHELERRKERDEVRRKLAAKLRLGGLGLGEVMDRVKGVWKDGGVGGEWVRRAICPGVKEKKAYWEGLSRRECEPGLGVGVGVGVGVPS
jgi:hypothetical protein